MTIPQFSHFKYESKGLQPFRDVIRHRLSEKQFSAGEEIPYRAKDSGADPLQQFSRRATELVFIRNSCSREFVDLP